MDVFILSCWIPTARPAYKLFTTNRNLHVAYNPSKSWTRNCCIEQVWFESAQDKSTVWNQKLMISSHYLKNSQTPSPILDAMQQNPGEDLPNSPSPPGLVFEQQTLDFEFHYCPN
jgi:hypothetical protein